VDGVTLAMDAATGVGTLAVFRDAQCLADRTVVMRSEQEERFLPALVGMLEEVSVSPQDLTRIVCGEGPGSFTSLRVVAAAAKGLAQGLGIPVVAAPSLALTVAADPRTEFPGAWLCTLDALRGERYAAIVTVGEAGVIRTVEELGRVAVEAISDHADSRHAIPLGPEEPMQAVPHARGVPRLWPLLASAGPVSLAAWEPRYGRLAEAQVKWEAAHGRALR
jgi:tRNA threonylcarbamoyladenosine biosynthesis protein TsaB